MSSRINEISQNSLSVHLLTLYLSELYLILFKVVCGFGVRIEILDIQLPLVSVVQSLVLSDKP